MAKKAAATEDLDVVVEEPPDGSKESQETVTVDLEKPDKSQETKPSVEEQLATKIREDLDKLYGSRLESLESRLRHTIREKDQLRSEVTKLSTTPKPIARAKQEPHLSRCERLDPCSQRSVAPLGPALTASLAEASPTPATRAQTPLRRKIPRTKPR